MWKGLERNIIFWCTPVKLLITNQSNKSKVQTFSNSHTHPQARRHIIEENTIDSSPQRHNWHFKEYSEGDRDWGRLTEKVKEKWNVLAFFLAQCTEDIPGWRKLFILLLPHRPQSAFQLPPSILWSLPHSLLSIHFLNTPPLLWIYNRLLQIPLSYFHLG